MNSLLYLLEINGVREATDCAMRRYHPAVRYATYVMPQNAVHLAGDSQHTCGMAHFFGNVSMHGASSVN